VRSFSIVSWHLVLVALASCGGAAQVRGNPPPVTMSNPWSARPLPPARPPIVEVTLLDAVIGPTKSDGRPWDGLGAGADREIGAGLDAAVAIADVSQSYATVLGLLAKAANKGLAAPEPYGSGEIARGAGGAFGEAVDLQADRDTCTPMWRPSRIWRHVELNDRVRIRIKLTDRDFQFDDPIGAVELNATDLRTALASGHNYHVRTAEQSDRQVLFVGVSVRAE
jgi:hypothetical protein